MQAIALVHLYDWGADFDAIQEACERYGSILIEDAAETLGAEEPLYIRLQEKVLHRAAEEPGQLPQDECFGLGLSALNSEIVAPGDTDRGGDVCLRPASLGAQHPEAVGELDSLPHLDPLHTRSMGGKYDVYVTFGGILGRIVGFG